MPPYKAIAKPIAATGVTRTSKNQAWKLSFNHLQSIAAISIILTSIWFPFDSHQIGPADHSGLNTRWLCSRRPSHQWGRLTIGSPSTDFTLTFSLSVRVILWSAFNLTLILLSFTWIEQWSSLQKHAIINRVNTIWRVSRWLRFIWNQNETMDCETRARSSICITSNNIPMQPPSVVQVESPSTCSSVIRDDLRLSATIWPTNLLICVMLLSPIRVKAEQWII